MYEENTPFSEEESENLSLDFHTGVSPEKQLRRALNVTALLSFLTVVFYVGASYVYPYAESFADSLFPTDDVAFMSLLDVYEMFEYTAGFFLPLAVVLLIFRDRIFRPYIPFAPRMPSHAISAIFTTIAVLYVFGGITNGMCAVYDALGLPIAYYEPSLPDSPIRILLYFVSSVILPAFVEEMIFRGYILHLLLPWGKTFAILVSAVLFGVMHLYLPQILYATVAGVLIGYFVVRAESVWIGIFIHACNNLISFTFDMAYLWLPDPYDEWYCILTEGAVLFAGMIGALILCYHNAHSDRAPHLETNAVYSRSLDTRAVLRRSMTVPMLMYLLCAAYYTIINSFIF